MNIQQLTNEAANLILQTTTEPNYDYYSAIAAIESMIDEQPNNLNQHQKLTNIIQNLKTQ